MGKDLKWKSISGPFALGDRLKHKGETGEAAVPDVGKHLHARG
ncbi:hypothetical protein [uncultured Senegalimassilia sp.]|nr:hypothetical protein [uncultured Senegalimassilia sp.]